MNTIIASLTPTQQAQLMYAFNEGIGQFVLIEGSHYIGCHLTPNPACFQPLQESGVWSYGIFKGCVC